MQKTWVNLKELPLSQERLCLILFKDIKFKIYLVFKYKLAICNGGEDINKISDRPVDPVAFGPFCRECHIIVGDPWR